MRLRIRTKVLITVSLSLVLMFAFIAFILVRQNTNSLRSSLNEQSKSFAALATDPIGDTFALYKDSGQIKITQQVNKFLELDPDVTAIRIVGVDGSELYSSLEVASPPLDSNLASSFEPQYEMNQKGYIEKVIQPYFEDSGAHRYSIVYRISTERVEQNVSEIIRLIFYVGVGMLVFTIAATVLLLNRLFIRPLRQVSESANIISSGDFDHKITSKTGDEIGDLATSVEKMADFLKADIVKLRELDKLKSEFMMITSHNLRTPIAIMQGYIEMAENAKSVEELKGIVDVIEESVVRLHLLAENILTISTLETSRSSVRKSSVDLAEFLNMIGREYGLLAKKKELKWEFINKIDKDLEIKIGSNNMRSALGNLVDNAIKFTEKDGSVTVDCRIEGGDFVFSVSDSGVGINNEEIPRLFTKFHRSSGSASYDFEGAGLGLYLSKLIIEQHGGKIEVESEIGKGSTFRISLPLAENT